MHSFTSILAWSAALVTVSAHGVILGAQGPAGPSSLGFLVDAAIARNCTTINPCQQDATIIRDAEIEANVVNECGRTELQGNIDIGEQTENALQAKKVTQVTAGSKIQVQVHQVNADGAGPYTCDLDMTSNSLGLSGQIPLKVEDNVPGVNGFSQAKAQNFNITVTLPDDLACIGASTGNVCTVRCRNAALAGPFGGCFPVQQTDSEANVNDPKTIATKQTIDGVLAQVAVDQADLGKAIEANQNAGSDFAKQNAAAVSALLQDKVVTSSFPVLTPTPASTAFSTVGASASASATATAGAGDAGNGGFGGFGGGFGAGNGGNDNGGQGAGNAFGGFGGGNGGGFGGGFGAGNGGNDNGGQGNGNAFAGFGGGNGGGFGGGFRGRKRGQGFGQK